MSKDKPSADDSLASRRAKWKERNSAHVVISFYPDPQGTTCLASIVTGKDYPGRRDVLWRGRLGVSSEDLRRLTLRRAVILLSDRLHEQWADEVRERMREQSDAGIHLRMAEPPAPPEGATGAALQNVPLPGL